MQADPWRVRQDSSGRTQGPTQRLRPDLVVRRRQFRHTQIGDARSHSPLWRASDSASGEHLIRRQDWREHLTLSQLLRGRVGLALLETTYPDQILPRTCIALEVTRGDQGIGGSSFSTACVARAKPDGNNSHGKTITVIGTANAMTYAGITDRQRSTLDTEPVEAGHCHVG